MSETVNISLSVNGADVSRSVAPRETLADFLRQGLELTGTHTGCEMGACGACLVLVDGHVTHSCLMFAVQTDGAAVETIEGLVERAAIADLQEVFHRRNALQCGFCTPGFIVATHDLLHRRPKPTDAEIREALAGNLCRCTGYEKILDAVRLAAERMSSA